MVKARAVVGIMLLALLVTCFHACKKTNETGVGFSVTSVSLDAIYDPTATVTVNLSPAVNGVTDLYFQDLGPDTFQFGSIPATFINDDSFRIVGALGGLVSIDTPIVGTVGHVTIPQGATNFTITLKALFDNFPKRAVQYKLKIMSVNNGTVVSGKDVLTINIAQAPMVPVFTSSITIKDVIYDFDTTYRYNNITLQFDTIYTPDSILVNSPYKLSSSSFTPASAGTYNFNLSYVKTGGNDSASAFTLNCLGITPTTGTTTYPTSDGLGTITTNFQLSPSSNALRGKYYIMNNTPNVITWSNNGRRRVATDTLACPFILF